MGFNLKFVHHSKAIDAYLLKISNKPTKLIKIEQHIHWHKPIQGNNAVMKVSNEVRTEGSICRTQVPKKTSLNDHIDIILSLENWLARIEGEEEMKNSLCQRIQRMMEEST